MLKVTFTTCGAVVGSTIVSTMTDAIEAAMKHCGMGWTDTRLSMHPVKPGSMDSSPLLPYGEQRGGYGCHGFTVAAAT